MPYGTASKYFSGDTPGAPAIFADAGGLVGMLDAVMVTGYGAAVISQIVVTDGVAVATTILGHSLRKWMVALNEETGHAGLDGEHRVIGAAGASYTFEVVGVPNGTYTGGSVKVAPLGFEISYSATNRRIYRSKDTERRNAVSLFVDDTNTVSGWNTGTNKALAQVKMVCDVVSIDNYTTLGTTWWFKSGVSSGTLTRPWLLAGDALGFYSAVDVNSGGYLIASNHFIQLNTLAAGDQFATMLEGAEAGVGAITTYAGLGCSGASMTAMAHGARRVARALSQTGVAQDLRFYGLGLITAAPGGFYGLLSSGARSPMHSTLFGQCMGLANVNPANAGLVLGQNVIAAHAQSNTQHTTDAVSRAIMPGLLSVPSVSQFAIVPVITEAPAGLPGSNLLGLPAIVGGLSYTADAILISAVGGYYIDVTKDWR